MTRKVWIALAAAVLVVAAGTSFVSASSRGAQERRVIETLEVNKLDALYDVAPAGDSSGDRESIRADLVDPDTMERLGFTQAVCVVVFLEPFGLECHGTIHLEDGVVTIAGSIVDDEDLVWAVTGGTGAFKRVRGYLTLAPAPNGNLFHTLYLFMR